MTHAEKISREAGAPGKSRSDTRERVLLGATVVCSQGSQAVRVRDLSKSGAHVVTERALPTGVDAIFKRADLFAAAHVVWSNEREAGLKFYREHD